jgi:TolB protein
MEFFIYGNSGQSGYLNSYPAVLSAFKTLKPHIIEQYCFIDAKRKSNMQIFYTVRPGDTLAAIARHWYIPLNSLIAANNLIPPFIMYPGQQLSMPPGVNTYVVKPGDSLYSIAAAYGIPIIVILQANGIEAPYTIMPGQVLAVPAGIPQYVVRPGDTLYGIARKYNVVLNGQVRPDLILKANYGSTPLITPGMTLLIPYPPPGGSGRIAVILFDGLSYYLQLYSPGTGEVSTLAVNEADSESRIFWSPDSTRIAVVRSSGIISVIDVNTKRVSRIDQISPPAFVDWSPDSKRLVYSKENEIRIYDVATHTFSDISRAGASYVQWFPNGTELLFEAKDPSGSSQLYQIHTDGSGERQITDSSNGPLNEVRLSPNGRFVLYTSPGVSISEIYTLDLTTGIINKIPGGPEAKNYYPTWSPDSTRIAYSSTQFLNGKYYSLIRASGLFGEGDSTLAISSCYATPVTWSPDSRKIAYLSGCRGDSPPVEMWSVDIGKLAPIRLMEGYTFYYLAWSRI